ncbi:alkaline phosphatase, partial [Pseudomonas sp. MWU12-2534b]
AEVARAMCAQADQVSMLADFSKLGVSSRLSTCAASDIDLLISNRQAADMPACQQLAALAGEIWLV